MAEWLLALTGIMLDLSQGGARMARCGGLLCIRAALEATAMRSGGLVPRGPGTKPARGFRRIPVENIPAKRRALDSKR